MEYAILFDVYHRMLNSVSLEFKRYLYTQINWDVRLLGIKGARGTGKTTLLLQHIKETFDDVDSVLYASLDNLWFNTHSLQDLAEYASSHGITHLFLDEVHHLKHWAQIIKNLYDTFPDLCIAYTSSSMAEINQSQADLSRRQTIYHLHGLSFREFLEFEGYTDVPCVTLEDLLSNHVKMAMSISSKFKILPLFERYIINGYYPFYRSAGKDYLLRLHEVINTVIDVDMPAVTEVSYATLQKTKKLLMVISENVPTTPILSALWAQIETTNDIGLKLMNLLNAADILGLYSNKPRNYKNLISPEKIFLNNTNLMYALSSSVNIGTARETFFFNQIGSLHTISLPKQGDCLVDGKWLFEIGGKRKTFEQIADLPNSYLAVDDTEVGRGNRIPLWMFGLLY